jgi:two-component system, NarL family, response regulator DesR
MGAVRILLVEPMTLLRRALAAVLSVEPDFEVAGEAATVPEALGAIRSVRPDALVLNVDLLSDPDGAVLRQLDRAAPGCPIVVLVDADSPGAARGELVARVHGVIGTDTAPEQLAGYLRRVAAGQRVIDPALAVAAWCAPPNPLTPRELEVLRIAAKGLPAAEIAATLHLSAGTVRNYLSAIMRKTDTRNRLEAIRAAEAAGWL